jgi:hypothetical protein
MSGKGGGGVPMPEWYALAAQGYREGRSGDPFTPTVKTCGYCGRKSKADSDKKCESCGAPPK